MRTSLFLCGFALRALLIGCTLALLAATGADAAVGWRAPLRPFTVTRHFEKPPTPYAAGHRGVDLAGVPGEQVLAAASGVVSYAGVLAGRGVVVIIHGTLRTTYEPINAVVRRGAAVVSGQQIGRLDAGHPGCPIAACLHWGLLRGETYLDPLAELKAPVIRLLPPTGMGPSQAQVFALAATPQGVSPGAMASMASRSRSSATTAWSIAAVAGFGTLMIFRRR